MINKFDFIVEEDNELKTYSYVDDKNELLLEIGINITLRQEPNIIINIRGIDPTYNPLFYFINKLILNGKLKNLNQINSIILPDKDKNIVILKDYINNIISTNTSIDTVVSINLMSVSHYPELLKQLSYLDDEDIEEEENEEEGE